MAECTILSPAHVPAYHFHGAIAALRSIAVRHAAPPEPLLKPRRQLVHYAACAFFTAYATVTRAYAGQPDGECRSTGVFSTSQPYANARLARLPQTSSMTTPTKRCLVKRSDAVIPNASGAQNVARPKQMPT